MQAATDLQYGRKDLERSAESNNLCQYFGQVIHLYLGKHFYFCISLLQKQVFPYLLRGSLAYMFSGLFMLMHYVKRICWKNVSSHQNFSCTAGQ